MRIRNIHLFYNSIIQKYRIKVWFIITCEIINFSPLLGLSHFNKHISKLHTERERTNFMARTLSLLEKLSHRIAKFTRMNTSVGGVNSDREELVPSIKCAAPQWICYVPDTLQHQANVRCNIFPGRLKFESYICIYLLPGPDKF